MWREGGGKVDLIQIQGTFPPVMKNCEWQKNTRNVSEPIRCRKSLLATLRLRVKLGSGVVAIELAHARQECSYRERSENNTPCPKERFLTRSRIQSCQSSSSCDIQLSVALGVEVYFS